MVIFCNNREGKENGLPHVEALWYYDPHIDGEISRLRDDIGIRRMKNIAENYDRVHLYVTHLVCKLEIVSLDPLIEYPIMAHHAKYTAPSLMRMKWKMAHLL